MVDELKPVFNTNSYISLGVAIIFLGGLAWLNTRLSDLHDGQRDVKFEVLTLQTRMEVIEKAKVVDRWSGTDMFKWAVKLQRDNPQIKVPEPKHEE